MRYIGLLFLFAGCSFDSTGFGSLPPTPGVDAGDEQHDVPSLLVATANVRCMVDAWDTRLGLLADEIVALGPDLLAVQEVCRVPGGRNGLDELVLAIAERGGPTYRSHRADTHFAWDQYDEGIAVLALDPFDSVEVIDLPAGLFPRRAVVARVHTRAGPVVFTSAHLSFGADQAQVRRDQLVQARAGTERVRVPGDTTVVAGDFNETPDGWAISGAREAGYADAWPSVHPDDPGATVPSRAPVSRIDYVLVGAGGLQVVDAGTFLNREETGVYASDHLGVWARLE